MAYRAEETRKDKPNSYQARNDRKHDYDGIVEILNERFLETLFKFKNPQAMRGLRPIG